MSGTNQSVSIRAFRALLWMYPQEFRIDYGPEMVQTFRDQWREASLKGSIPLAKLWGRTLLDAFASGLRERSEKMKRNHVLMACAVALGLLIAWADSRPGWDDTGISAGALLIASAVFGLMRPERAWRWALAVGIWIPLYGSLWTRNSGSVIALIPAFLGAYIGAGIRRIGFPPPSEA